MYIVDNRLFCIQLLVILLGITFKTHDVAYSSYWNDGIVDYWSNGFTSTEINMNFDEVVKRHFGMWIPAFAGITAIVFI